MKTEYICRICGFQHDTPTWEEGNGSGDICFCCGVLYGYEDGNLLAINSYRKKWIHKKSGGWFSSYIPSPKNWNVCDQIKKIDQKWIDTSSKQLFNTFCKYE